jgi:hypothetical protein
MEDNLTYRVLRVKDTAFSVNEILYDPAFTLSKTQVRINCELKFNIDVNYVIFELNPLYLYEYPDKEEIFASINVHNAFEVNDVKSFIKDGKLYLPPALLITLMGISISHTRALFSKSIEGTAYSGIVLPLVDPVAFCKLLFAYMFDENVGKENPVQKDKKKINKK